jgi:biopolymer transport protein ExbD
LKDAHAMADKRQVFDVWILEINTVYRQVPFLVITDWVQQGRLLAEDKIRPSGTEKWVLLESVPEFAPYLPKVEPYRVEDRAEALEPVAVDFAWKERGADADEDVDMIPLIDISLVLLIFFMMTAAVGGAGASILTPEAQYKLLMVQPQMLWIGMDRDPATGNAVYSLGAGDSDQGTQYSSKSELLQHLGEQLQKENGPVDVRVRASKQLPCELVIQDMNLELEKLKGQRKLRDVYTEVSEKKNQ